MVIEFLDSLCNSIIVPHEFGAIPRVGDDICIFSNDGDTVLEGKVLKVVWHLIEDDPKDWTATVWVEGEYGAGGRLEGA